eukprot:2776473-Pyramimonas_sp.AAC.2
MSSPGSPEMSALSPPCSKLTGTSSSAARRAGESSVRIPLHLCDSTRRPAALSAQERAIAARSACLVVLSKAARSST